MFAKSRFALLIGVVLALLVSMPIFAQWSGTWVSSFQVMNLGDQKANVSVVYYKEDGSVAGNATYDYQVEPKSSVNIYQPNVPNLPGGFKGSAVISADQPIAAIGSEQVTYADNRIGHSQYSGVGAAELGKKFYLPNINKRFGGSQWSSRITIQNATTSNAAGTVTYYSADGTLANTQSVNLQPRGSVTLVQLDNASLPNGWLGSAVVDMDQDVAVVADVMSADGRVETYNGFSSGATSMFLPTLLINFGANAWNTSFQVLNISDASATVTMKYYTPGSATPAKTVTETIAKFNSINRYQPNVDADLVTGGSWIGSVVIESTQPIVAVGSQSSAAPGKQLASIYNGAARGALEGYLPTILKNFGGSNFITSFQVMNVGSAAASVRVEYYTTGQTSPIKTVLYDGVQNPKIERFNSVNRYQGNDAELPASWQGSVKVTSDQPIVLLGSQNGLARTGDAAGQYNGILP